MTLWSWENKPNHKDHDTALTNLLNTARECNVCLNCDKLQYKQTEVDFFGKTYTTDGRKPSQSKVKAIQEIPLPQSKKQVQSFIGMVNYLSQILCSIIRIAKPIRELSKERVPSTRDWNIRKHFTSLRKKLQQL